MSSSSRHDEPSLGGSACSTVSTRRGKYLYNKIPQKPDENDPVKWAQFLSAYQRGDWESTQRCPNQCTKKAQKVQLANGEWIDSREFFSKNNYLAAPPVPREKARLRNEVM